MRNCVGCESHQYHIASLKDEIRSRDALIESLRDQLEATRIDQQRIIEHITGMNRNVVAPADGEMHSIRRSSGIQDRIRRAERLSAEKAEPINAVRRKEYDARFASVAPELVLVEDVEGHAV